MLGKPDAVYLFQGDPGSLLDALGESMQASPRVVGENLYMFGSSLALADIEERLTRPDNNFVLIAVRDYAAVGLGTPLMGALFEMF
ncbi:hypothetical protein [Stutzerimonas nitrititolerans]|uniref:hypothetical protein n=1 Tax=Stutzerimonas nitrititolerans TaxID=2482751 RepID=UPI0028AF6412|nr:hypothetical protein [Stutzerimonas nitrititolerans]